jgi:EAL domain-containing protein (putative c-di-GMP-specific phosphodiesterase class I)
VNLSAKQLRDPGFVEDVRNTLLASGLNPRCLKLEITESLTLDYSDRTLATIHELRELGVKLAIDDFGAGHSTLTYLKHYPVDTLKLDRHCIAGLDKNPEDTAIIHAALACAKVLNLSVTAEGIETSDQADRLRGLGCSHAQGYYFSRPVEEKTITQMLAKQWPEFDPSSTGVLESSHEDEPKKTTDLKPSFA